VYILDPKTQIPALDGVRGLAILLVILYHCCGLPFGWVGVDLFFVLSGFLITRILLAKQDQPDYFKNFYKNRILRIFPLYFLVLTLYFTIEYVFYHKNIAYSLYFFFFLQNTNFAKTAFENAHGLQHTWSLAIEEQFYAVFPFAVYFLNKKRRCCNECVSARYTDTVCPSCSYIMADTQCPHTCPLQQSRLKY
jgi:peptidoglycan/LPS O-acetylase OafA/YrhL